MVGKGSVNHNSRKFHAKNIDPERSNQNIEYCNEDIRDVYDEVFGEALTRYNKRQTRKDRMIDNYYEKICSGKQEKPFHEIILQIGNRDNCGSTSREGIIAATVLNEYMKTFQQRNPSLRVFSAHLHMDEATPHLHIDFVPFTTGSKRGLDTRVSLKQALADMGFKGGTRSETEWNQWITSEKKQLAAVMERHGIEWEQKNTHEEHISVLDFKRQERSREVAELEEKQLELTYTIIDKQLTVHSLESTKENIEQEVEKLQIEVDAYTSKVNDLKPIIEQVDKNLASFQGTVNEMLPKAGVLELASSYRDNKAKPLFIKMRNVIKGLSAKLQQTVNELKVIKSNNKNLKMENEDLKSQCEQLQESLEKESEKAALFDRVGRVLGFDTVSSAIKKDMRREYQEKETEKRRQEEKPPETNSVLEKLNWHKQHLKETRKNDRPNNQRKQELDI